MSVSGPTPAAKSSGVTTATDQRGTDPDNPFEILDEELRTRALLALRQGCFDLAETLLAGKYVDQAALVERLRTRSPIWSSSADSVSVWRWTTSAPAGRRWHASSAWRFVA
jgi:hypothetical protein